MGRNPSVMKHSLLLSTVALAAVSAQQQGYKPQPQPQQGYRPQPVEEVEVPRPYKYQYGVKDDYSSSNFAKTETQDDKKCCWHLRDRPARWKDPDHQVHR